MRAPWRQQLDFVMHYSSGVAISLFLWRDLIADATGALTTLTLTWIVRCFTMKRQAAAAD